MDYHYIRPAWCKAKSERDTEIRFLLTELYNLFAESKNGTLLDVGFAGSGYIEKILEFDMIDYTGLDCNADRISGDTLHISEATGNFNKKKWREILARIKYIEADILNYSSNILYDIVISISAIEHIVPMEYRTNTEFNLYGDIVAVNNMKKLVGKGGHLLLTFPCGKECVLSPEENFKNKLKNTPLENKLIKHRHHILIYNEDRIGMLIGDWRIVRERYWMDFGRGFEECEKTVACEIEYESSDRDIKSLCALLLA